MATRWGIAGSGKICSDFVTAMKALLEGDHRLVAVADRALENAQAFAQKHKVEKAYGSHQELANDSNIEVVYIGVINPHHLNIATMMIKAGKHVLCEKPLCMNVKETKQLVGLARQNKVFLMEAVWSRCFPVYKEMMRRIDAGEIGDVVQVFATVGAPIEHVERLTKKAYGGGVTLDMGLYTVQFATLIMRKQRPLKVLAGGHLNRDGVDETTSATLVYPGGKVATLNCSMRCQLPTEGIVVGTKGTIKVNSPLGCPESLESPSGKFVSSLPVTGQSFNWPNNQGLMYEAAEVRRCLKEGLLESPLVSLDETLLMAEILEDIRKQVGVVYDQD